MSGQVISWVSVSGGAGHTTVALDAAYGLAPRGSVAILDFEDRATDEWSKWRIPEGITLFRTGEHGEQGSLDELRKRFAFVLIHARLQAGPVMRKHLEVSDLVIVP